MKKKKPKKINEKILNDFISKQRNVVIKEYEASQEKIILILKRYSLKDVLSALFTSNIWLPNISSPVKHQFLYSLLLSLDPKEFSNSNKINNYEQFLDFLNQIYKNLPTFPSLEDYVPETDWGDVKYKFNHKIFKIFYGNELSNIYEYITLFEIIFGSYDRELFDRTGRSPLEEMTACLTLQDYTINNIQKQKKINSLDIVSGHIEVPPENFFNEIKKFFSKLNHKKIIPNTILEHYCKNLELTEKNVHNWDDFGSNVFSGKLLPCYFLSYKSDYYSILPRRYFAILFDSWSKIFEDNKNYLLKNKTHFDIKIGSKIFNYIRNRTDSENLFQATSAVTTNGKPHRSIFACSFISKNKLILLYQLPLCSSNKEIEDFLSANLIDLKEALSLVSKSPTSLALHTCQQNVQFHSKEASKILVPYLITLIPQTSTSIQSISIPKDLPGSVMFLDSFLGIIDELDNIDTLSDFIDYSNNNKNLFRAFCSPLDLFGAFKDSMGVLVGGAISPNIISIDPHWGTNKRYETLKEFWNLYPEIGYFNDPKSWEVKAINSRMVRLKSRSFFGLTFYAKKLSQHFFFTAPFIDMTYEQGQIAYLLMECLEDSFELRKNNFSKHLFFKQNIYNSINIVFIPISLVSKNNKYHHLLYLNPNDNYWNSDYQIADTKQLVIRIVFNDTLLADVFEKTTDSSIEVEILKEFLKNLNALFPDESIEKFNTNLEKTKNKRPRFKLFLMDKKVAFPNFIHSYHPENMHFKKARKRIAEISKSIGIKEGTYNLEDAKTKINNLKKLLIQEIDNKIKKYDFASAIPFLLSRIDALADENFRNQSAIEHGLTIDTEYNPNEKYVTKHSEFLDNHKNYRYLIEKFVYLEPQGSKILDKENFQHLIAFIDWILVFYSASDCLHYGIHPTKMNVSNDFTVEIEMEKNFEEKENAYAEHFAKIKLGIIGNPDDKIDIESNIETFLKELDEAFFVDKNFKLSDLTNLSQLLATWPYYQTNKKENSFYKATGEQIINICSANITNITKQDVLNVLDFLTLKKEEVLLVSNSTKPCDDLPIWEHKKRPSRYTIKPLIKINGFFYWAPYSIRQAGRIWLNRILDGALPANISGDAIKLVVKKQKSYIENLLAKKAHEVVSKHTKYSRMNLWLHKIDKISQHPPDLGDYDVFAYFQEKNLILLVESKDILPAYCLKDTKTLRERIFGKSGKKGEIEQVLKRHSYVEKNAEQIFKVLSWPLNKNSKINILSIFVSRYDYWWTYHPPIDTKILFTRIDLLSHAISQVLFSKKTKK